MRLRLRMYSEWIYERMGYNVTLPLLGVLGDSEFFSISLSVLFIWGITLHMVFVWSVHWGITLTEIIFSISLFFFCMGVWV